jgi:drug/metabolite transporter (DMT)-like permease
VTPGVLLAVCAAASNAVGTVFQRKAARLAPATETMRPALLWDLMRRPVWLVGIGGMIGGFLFQACALGFAALTVVQPIVVFELPLTVGLAAVVFHRPLDRRAVWGTIAVSAGVSLALVATDPRPGPAHPARVWPIAVAVTVTLAAALVTAGMRTTGARRAALFGTAAGLGFGFTAALLNGSLRLLEHGLGHLLTSWQPYATIAAGLISVFLTQNALQAGPVAAAQPAITTCDPLASVAYGVLLFGEQLRAGLWLLPALAGALLAIVGIVLLSQSPLANAQPHHRPDHGTSRSALSRQSDPPAAGPHRPSSDH